MAGSEFKIEVDGNPQATVGLNEHNILGFQVSRDFREIRLY